MIKMVQVKGLLLKLDVMQHFDRENVLLVLPTKHGEIELVGLNDDEDPVMLFSYHETEPFIWEQMCGWVAKHMLVQQRKVAGGTRCVFSPTARLLDAVQMKEGGLSCCR